MLNFDNIEDLVSYMFANLDNEDNLVSVIADKEIIVVIMNELLDYKNVILNSCDIDDNCDYSKEYRISLYDDIDSDYWYVNVEKDYDSENGHYLGADGYVLFHEDTNSKSLIDKQNNVLMALTGHDLFVIGEETLDDEADNDQNDDNTEDIDADIDTNDENVDSGYSVTVKVDLDTIEAEKIICDMERNMKRELSNMFDLLYRPYLYEYHPLPMRFFY